jgi:hypothetical protein
MHPPPSPEQALLEQLEFASYQGAFESHITTLAEGPAERRRFREVCRELDVKCVLIELSNGATPSQPMTARYHQGAIGPVVEEVRSLCRRLRQEGFPITRVKLEAVASNAGVPEQDDEAARFPASNYFEFHLKLALPAGIDLEPLRTCCDRHAARLSRNALKTEQDGRSERFVTLRLPGIGRRSAFARLDALERDLGESGFPVVNRQREYTIFDSAEQLDAGWIDRPPLGGKEP